MPRQTKQDREREQMKQTALELRDRRETELGKIVVNDSRTLLSTDFASSIRREMKTAAYDALSAVEYLAADVDRKVKWTAGKLDELRVDLARGNVYNNVALQNVDDLNGTYCRYYEARRSAKMLFNVLGFHCDLLEDARSLAQRERLMQFSVEPEDDRFVVMFNGERAREFGRGDMDWLQPYSEEWLAWLAVNAVL